MIYSINHRTKEHRKGVTVRGDDWEVIELGDDGWIAFLVGDDSPVPSGTKCEYRDTVGTHVTYRPEHVSWDDVYAYRPILDVYDYSQMSIEQSTVTSESCWENKVERYVSVHTDTLKGVALHWAVAKATDTPIEMTESIYKTIDLWIAEFKDDLCGSRIIFQPSYSAHQGLELIEKFFISTQKAGGEWWATMPHATGLSFSGGDRLLLAAMRALVNNKMGRTIEIPDFLIP